jgi:hypothetical protein
MLPAASKTHIITVSLLRLLTINRLLSDRGWPARPQGDAQFADELKHAQQMMALNQRIAATKLHGSRFGGALRKLIADRAIFAGGLRLELAA